jgi:hypothetical protein
VGDYVGALCQPLAGPILEPNGLRFEANIEDGFLDTKRCERLGLRSPTRRKMFFRIENPDGAHRSTLSERLCWRCTVKDNGVAQTNFRRGIGEKIVAD